MHEQCSEIRAAFPCKICAPALEPDSPAPKPDSGSGAIDVEPQAGDVVRLDRLRRDPRTGHWHHLLGSARKTSLTPGMMLPHGAETVDAARLSPGIPANRSGLSGR